MSEPMVRIVEVICERHGLFRPSAAVLSPADIRKMGCGHCMDEEYPWPHPIRIATEPVDLEPREEQAG